MAKMIGIAMISGRRAVPDGDGKAVPVSPCGAVIDMVEV
jgi:hypothetical protein